MHTRGCLETATAEERDLTHPSSKDVGVLSRDLKMLTELTIALNKQHQGLFSLFFIFLSQ